MKKWNTQSKDHQMIEFFNTSPVGRGAGRGGCKFSNFIPVISWKNPNFKTSEMKSSSLRELHLSGHRLISLYFLPFGFFVFVFQNGSVNRVQHSSTKPAIQSPQRASTKTQMIGKPSKALLGLRDLVSWLSNNGSVQLWNEPIRKGVTFLWLFKLQRKLWFSALPGAPRGHLLHHPKMYRDRA